MTRNSFFLLLSIVVLSLSCQQEQGQNSSATILCLTSDATSISQTSAVLNGTAIIKDAKASNANAYFYYSTTSGDAKTIKASGQRVSAGNIPNSGGDFSYNLGSLMPSTTYYYVASVAIDDAEELGGIKTLTTESSDNNNNPSSIAVTGTCTEIGESSALLYGWCNQEGAEGASVVFGIEYSDTDLTTSAVSLKASEKDMENKFFCHATGLSSNTLYYYRAYVQFNGVKTFGEIKSFTTSSFSAQTTSLAATNITEFKATLNGNLKVDSVDDLGKAVWFLFSDSASTLDDLKANGREGHSSLNQNGRFSCDLTSLSYNTTYYYVACSRVHDKDCFGEVKSFTTKDIIATVTTSEASNIGFNKATLRGLLSVENTISLNKTVGFWYGEGTTAEQLKTSGTKVEATLNSDGSFSCQLTLLSPNRVYYIIAYAIVYDKEFISDVKTITTNDVPSGAVDLGLSVAWATCNIGASSPDEYGYYYAWGEIETKSNYEWSTYKFNTSGSDDYEKTVLTKYCTNPEWGEVDGKLTLDPEDDVAHITLGGSWRMPTTSEWRELCEKCSWKWGSLNGIKGFTITSTITGNSIFIPAAGQMWGTDNSEQGSHGAYWSSQQQSSFNIRAYYLDFGEGHHSTGSHDKCRGRSVRAVVD